MQAIGAMMKLPKVFRFVVNGQQIRKGTESEIYAVECLPTLQVRALVPRTSLSSREQTGAGVFCFLRQTLLVLSASQNNGRASASESFEAA